MSIAALPAAPASRSRAALSPRRLTLLLLVGAIAGFAAFALPHFLPAQPYGLADDYRVFYAASRVLAHGGNPFDPATIHAAEQSADFYPQVQPSLDDYVNLPVVAWAMRPLTALPFWASYAVFTAAGAGALLAAIALLARDLGWRRRAPLLLLVPLSWISLLGFLSGQFDALLLAGLALSLHLAIRNRPTAAGAVCALVWVKPDLTWPVLPLLALALWPDVRAAARVLGGFAAATAGVLLLQLATTASLLPAWWHHLTLFAGRVDRVQPDLAGLPSLLRALPGGAGGGLTGGRTLAAVAAGLALATAIALRSARTAAAQAAGSRPRRLIAAVCIPLGLWLLVAPYAHPNDDLLLLPVVLLVLGPDAVRLDGAGLRWAVVLTCAGALIWPIGVLPAAAAPLLLAVAVAGVVAGRRSPGLAGFGPAVAVLAMVLLPAVWPFHVLAYSLTPAAVLLLCAEAVIRPTAGGSAAAIL
jgi:hypothetical protein